MRCPRLPAPIRSAPSGQLRDRARQAVGEDDRGRDRAGEHEEAQEVDPREHERGVEVEAPALERRQRREDPDRLAPLVRQGRVARQERRRSHAALEQRAACPLQLDLQVRDGLHEVAQDLRLVELRLRRGRQLPVREEAHRRPDASLQLRREHGVDALEREHLPAARQRRRSAHDRHDGARIDGRAPAAEELSDRGVGRELSRDQRDAEIRRRASPEQPSRVLHHHDPVDGGRGGEHAIVGHVPEQIEHLFGSRGVARRVRETPAEQLSRHPEILFETFLELLALLLHEEPSPREAEEDRGQERHQEESPRSRVRGSPGGVRRFVAARARSTRTS